MRSAVYETSPRILIVDDEPTVRDTIGRALTTAGYCEVFSVSSVPEARQAIAAEGPFDLVLLDIHLPGESGFALLEDLAPKAPRTIVMMVTGADDARSAVEALKMGAHEYLVKPLDMDALRLVVGRTLSYQQFRLKADRLSAQIEREVERRLDAMEKLRRALLGAMCRMSEFRDPEPSAHLERVAHYSRLLAQQLGGNSPYGGLIDDEFVQDITVCAPLHDMGKVGVPDSVLMKPGKLTDDEMAVMQKHCAVGRDICRWVRQELGTDARKPIEMAVQVTGGHHERWDGTGYPDALRGADIPLSARIVGLADFYDACRSVTVYRAEPIPRDKVVALIEKWAGEKFDPVVVNAFRQCGDAVIEVEGGPRR